MERTVAAAFQAVPRKEFLPEDMQPYANEDRPLSIGYDQTNSQPTTVRRMLKWLDAKRGMKVLDVGSGSGWTSALLSYLVTDEGEVHAVERVPELARFGEENCERLGLKNVTFHEAGKDFGLPDEAPFDRILVSAATNELPQELVSQLIDGGRMVIPIGNDVMVVEKRPDGSVHTRPHHGFVFVPLIGERKNPR